MITLNCLQCGAEIHTYPSRVGKKKFCSKSCLGEWRRNEAQRVFAEQNSTLEKTRQRFIACVDVRGADECWPWKLALTPRGYGQFQLPGVRDQRKSSHAAYVLFVGPVPPSHDVHHTCENKACVNWRHLEAVPHGGPDSHGSRHRRTHCKRGHELVGDNVYVRPDTGQRMCRPCQSMRNKRFRSERFHSEQP